MIFTYYSFTLLLGDPVVIYEWMAVAEDLPDLRMRRANYQLVKGSKHLDRIDVVAVIAREEAKPMQ